MHCLPLLELQASIAKLSLFSYDITETVDFFFVVNDDHLFKGKIFCSSVHRESSLKIGDHSLIARKGYDQIFSKLSHRFLDYTIVINVSKNHTEGNCLYETFIHELLHIHPQARGALRSYDTPNGASSHGDGDHEKLVKWARSEVGAADAFLELRNAQNIMEPERFISAEKYKQISAPRVWVENASELGLPTKYVRRVVDIP